MNVHRRVAVVALALTALLALSPGAVAASLLDPTFGTAGRASLPAQLEGFWARAAVLTHDDGLVIGAGESLTKLDPRGRLDRSFGAGGTVTIPTAPDHRFQVAGLAVDSNDRLLVAGTTLGSRDEGPPAMSFFNSSELPQTARVLRYLPNGTLDPGFGEAGEVESDFGLPPPRRPDGEQILSDAWVELTGVAVDAEDRVVLTGAASVGARAACLHDWFSDTVTYAALVARLTEAGSLDHLFSADGIYGGRSALENPLHAEVVADPLIGTQGQVIYSSSYGHCPRAAGLGGLAALAPDGGDQLPFNKRGAARVGGSETAIAPDGSILRLGFVSPWYYQEEPERAVITRLRPDGSRARSYGRDGHTVVVSPGGPGSSLDTLAVDRSGRTLLGGTMVGRKLVPGPTARAKKRRRQHFALVRIDRRGHLDRSFGPRGRLTVGFGRGTLSQPKLLIDSEGRAVIVGTYGQERGFAIARFRFADPSP